MIEVLVAGELEPFLRRTAVPGDVRVRLLAPQEPVPAGSYAGLLPLLTRPIGRDELSGLPQLRIVANYGAGYDNIDVTAARARGVAVTNTPDVLTAATAELTWALILATARRLPEGERMARSGGWQGWHPTQLLGTSLEGKLLGIVGAGRIGRAVGRRAPAFGMQVAYWSRTWQHQWAQEIAARRLGLDQLLSSADVVSIHVSLTRESEKLIDVQALALMRPSAILINTARGRIIDEAALINALENGRLRAAGLDVYAEEPGIPERLRSLDNVVLLPHLGSATEEARTGMWNAAWDNLIRGLRGQPLLHPV